MAENKKLQGKVAVITGGTSGIGLAAAKLFVREGVYVFITGAVRKSSTRIIAITHSARRRPRAQPIRDLLVVSIDISNVRGLRPSGAGQE